METSVVYDHQIFSYQQYGGISRYLCELAKRVGEAKGFSATVVAPITRNIHLRDACVNTVGLHIPILPKTTRLVSFTNGILSPIIIRALVPNIVHETYYSFAPVAPKGCPVVVTVHDMIHEKYREYFPKSDTTLVAKRAAVARADLIICVSRNTQEDLIECYGVRPERTIVIYHGVTQLGATPAGQPRGTKGGVLLYVGSRTEYKNFGRLVQALALSTLLRKNFKLVAFGGGPFTMAEIALFRDLGLNEAMVKQISGPDEVLFRLYREATALVYPSLYEGFGFPPLEAMTQDCPVICSEGGSIKEVVGNAGFHFDPYNVDSIIQAIESVVSSESLRRELAREGRERVKLFTWARCAEQTIAGYRSLVCLK